MPIIIEDDLGPALAAAADLFAGGRVLVEPLDRVAREVVKQAQANLGGRGNLAKTIELKESNYASGEAWRDVGSDDPAAGAQHDGSATHATSSQSKWKGRPYPIVAKPGKRLAFFWMDGPQAGLGNRNGLHFFQKVMHPGVKPKFFLRHAMTDVGEPGLEQAMAQVEDAAEAFFR